MNKYYTPAKKEFYVGFEYEWRRSGGGLFEKTVIKDGTQIDDIFNSIYDLRVKYLNQEDIESLEFSDKKSAVLDLYTYKDSIDDNWCSYGKWWSVTLMHDKERHKIKIVGKEDYEETLFQGDCKNKSEFIKILNQIGIDTNK